MSHAPKPGERAGLAARHGAVACIALLLLWAPAARGDAVATPDSGASFWKSPLTALFHMGETAVILPGHEELLAAMLGRGAALPGGCALTSGQIEATVVRGVYACPGGEVVVELRHPSAAPADAARTDTMALVLVRGAPPGALLPALQERVRAREGGFAWQHLRRADGVDREVLAWWIRAGEAFFIVLGGGIVAALWQWRRRLTRQAVPLLLLTGLALLLRALAHGGPADIRAVLDETRASRGGFAAFSQLVFTLLPAGDESMWTLNRVLGALSVPLLYAVVRQRFADPLIALAAATALAVTPLLVRFSASDTPYIPLCAAWLAALVALDRYVERPATATLALALGLLTAAMQLRPDGMWLVVPASLLMLAGPAPAWSAVRWPTVIACALVFIALNGLPAVVALSGHAEGGYLGSFVLIGSSYGSPWAEPAMTPRSLAALVGLGGLVALGHGRAGILWLAATLVADPLDFPAAGGLGQYANARYHIPAMYLACGLIGIGVAAPIRLLGRWLPRESHAAALAAVAVIALAAAPRRELLWRMWTPQREFAFFRDGLTQVDPTCRVVTLAETSDAGFAPFNYLAPNRLVDIRRFLTDRGAGCAVYYRAGNCYSDSLDVTAPHFEMYPPCAEIERLFRLEPIVEAQLPADPYRGEHYVRDPLPVGFYRLQPLDAAAPHAATPPALP